MRKKDAHWHSLLQVLKVNISTIIAWKKAIWGNRLCKMKVRCPVNMKIIPEKHDLCDDIEQGHEL